MLLTDAATRPRLLFAAGVTVGLGAWSGHPWLAAGGGLVLLGVLAAALRSALPRPVRWWLAGGLLALMLAVVVDGVDLSSDVPLLNPANRTAVTDDVLARMTFQQQAVTAGGLFAACCCFGLAIGRLSGHRLRQFGRTAAVLGPATLCCWKVVALVPALPGLLGSTATALTAVTLALGGYGWLVHRTARRYSALVPAAIGATGLATAAGLALDRAWSTWPATGGPLTFADGPSAQAPDGSDTLSANVLVDSDAVVLYAYAYSAEQPAPASDSTFDAWTGFGSAASFDDWVTTGQWAAMTAVTPLLGAVLVVLALTRLWPTGTAAQLQR